MADENEKEVDFDNMPLSEGKDESVSSGIFTCETHDVHDVIKKDDGSNAGKKLFLHGSVKETGEKIEISQSIVEQKDGVIRESGMWVKIVSGKLRVGTLVSTLQHYKIKSIGDIDGKKFKIQKNPQGYWVLIGTNRINDLEVKDAK